MNLTGEEYEYIYQRVPRVCVDLIVSTPKGVVLTKRSLPPAIGKWAFPGGGIKYGESIEGALRRISWEELRAEVLNYRFFSIDEYPPGDDWRHSIGLSYIIYFESNPPTAVKLIQGTTKSYRNVFKKHQEILKRYFNLNPA